MTVFSCGTPLPSMTHENKLKKAMFITFERISTYYSGELFMFFTASDGYYNTTSNMFIVRVVDELGISKKVVRLKPLCVVKG